MHAPVRARADRTVGEGRSVCGIPFITSYYFPLSRAAAAAAAAVNIPFHRPDFTLVFLLSRRIQLAFKRRRLWQGVNPARGIPPPRPQSFYFWQTGASEPF